MVMYNTLAVSKLFYSFIYLSIYLFIYLLDYKDEDDRQVFGKIETKAGWKNTFKKWFRHVYHKNKQTLSTIKIETVLIQNIWVFKLIAFAKSTRNDVESV